MTEKLRGTANKVQAAQAAHKTFKAGRTMVWGGLAALTLFSMTGTARAQFVEPSARKPYAFRIGDYLAADKDVRSGGGPNILALEFDYTIQKLPERSSVSVVSLGYMERSNFRMIPITVSQIFRDPGSKSEIGKSYYYGLGVGLYSTRFAWADTSGKVKLLPGAFAVLGLDLSDKLFVEAKYHYISKYDNKNVGGLQLSVGTRF